MTPEAPQVRLSALLLAGCGDRDDAVVPGVQRMRHAPDGAALAGGIHALEHDDQGTLGHARIAGEQIETSLQGLEPLLIGLGLERARVVEGVQQALSVEWRVGHGRGHRHHRPLPGQPSLKGIEQVLPNRERPVRRVAAIDHQPRRLAGAGLAQGLLTNSDELVVVLEMGPIVGGDTPRGLGIRRQGFQTSPAGLLGQMKPALDDDSALGHQHALELAYALQALRKARALLMAHHVRQDRIGIPGAEQDAKMPFGGQHLPEAPHLGTRTLRVADGAEHFRADVARVHPFVEQIDGFALARTVHPIDQNDHRRLAIGQQRVLGRQQG